MNLRRVGAALLLVGTLARMQPRVQAQGAVSESFEVASIRLLQVNGGPVPGCCSDTPSRSGGRIRWITTTGLMLQYAYNVPSWRISGNIPDSIFEVNAEADPVAGEDRIRAMFQKLLADRLKMTLHREVKDMSGFAIVQGGKGAKIKAYGPDDAAAPLPAWFRFMGDIGLTRLEGKCTISFENGFNALTGRRVPMSRLAQVLANHFHTFVLDNSGLTGNYYFGFLFTPDGNSGNLDGPDLFTAIQEELGLKLERQKGPTDILIIDRTEKIPTAN